jgi:PAS domain S-box-containing protein
MATADRAPISAARSPLPERTGSNHMRVSSARTAIAGVPAAPSNLAIRRLRHGTLRGRMMMLVVATVMPMVLVSMYAASRHYAAMRAGAEAALVEQARTLALAVDRDAMSLITLVTILAATSTGPGDQMAQLQVGLAIAKARLRSLTISVAPSSAPPHAVSPPGARPPAETAGDARFGSPLVPGDAATPALSVTRTVELPDHRMAIVTIGADRARMQDTLSKYAASPGWVTAIIDGHGRVVARSVNPETVVGDDTNPAVRAGLAADGAGFVRARDMEGAESRIAFARAPLTGFAAVISIPNALFAGPLRAAVLRMLALALPVAALATGLALLLARQISASLRGVADDLAAGAEPRAGFAEIVDLAAALQAATRQRDQTLAGLARQEELLHRILDNLPLSVVVTDEKGKATFANARAVQETGDSLLATRNDREALFHPCDRMRLHIMRASWASGRPQPPVELRYAVRGVQRWHLLQGVFVRAPNDGSRSLVVISLDVHDAHEARGELAAVNVALEERVAERTRELSDTAAELTAELSRRAKMQAALALSQKREALGRLTGGVAHDINNVLAVITNSYVAIELATGASGMDGLAAAGAQVRGSIAMGRAAVAHATDLIRHLTAFARQHPLAATVVDTKSELRDIAALCRHALGEGFTLRLELPETDLGTMSIDAPMLRAALLNLVANAREAMVDGGEIAVAVRAAAYPRAAGARPDGTGEGTRDATHDAAAHRGGDATASAGCVAISVRDSGCGMSAARIARAAEPFFTTKAARGGSGLGLAMVEGFVAQSGGVLTIDSSEGVGTTVTLFLPAAAALPPAIPAGPAGDAPARQLADAPVADAPLSDAPLADGPLADGPRGRTVLLVDDNAALLRSTALLLRGSGYNVIEAADARTAFALAGDHPEIDLVLTDIVMPHVTGTQLAARLFVLRPDLPVIFITGFAGDQRAIGGRVVLHKPADLREMLAAFDEALRMAGEPVAAG